MIKITSMTIFSILITLQFKVLLPLTVSSTIKAQSTILFKDLHDITSKIFSSIDWAYAQRD